MNNSTTFYTNDENLVATYFVGLTVLCIYLVGVYLHIKVILISKKEQDLTWKIDIANSILLIVLFANKILIQATTYLVEDIYIYTGEWLCYTSEVIIHYTILYNGGHSMTVSMLKYFVIVHHDKFRHHKEKLKQIFFWINILHPILFIILHLLLVPHFYKIYTGFSSINKCLGKTKDNNSKWWSLCALTVPSESIATSYPMYILKSSTCKVQVVLIYIIMYNVFDMFFYCRIFSHMRR